MKLTRRRIDESKNTATFYRDTYRGLLYFQSEEEDRTEKVVDSMDFERSWRGRILKNAEKEDKEGRKTNPFYNIVEGLVNSNTEINCSLINTTETDIDKLLNKNLTGFGKELKASDSLFTLKELLEQVLSGENPDNINSELKKVRKMIGSDIEKRKEQLIKSITHNNIPFSINYENKLVPSSEKMKWLYELLPKEKQKIQDDPKIKEKFNKCWRRYNYEKFEPVIIEKIESLLVNNECTLTKEVRKTVKDYNHQLIQGLAKSSEEDQIFRIFLDEVEIHFEIYFPNKPRRNNDLISKEKNYKLYCSCNYVKNKVNRFFISRLVVVSKIEEKLNKYWSRYSYEKLEPVIIKEIESLSVKNARTIANKVSRTVRDYHHEIKLGLTKESVEDQYFRLFLKAVEQHFKKCYPVKSKHSNKIYDKFICQSENYKSYCSNNYVKKEVNRSIINQLVAGLIQQGKLIHYFYENGFWRKEYLNSHGLSYIQIEEAFKKSLMCSLSWGINRLNFFYNDGVVEFPKNNDILLDNRDIVKYRTGCYSRIRRNDKNDKIQEHFKEKLAACFPIKVNEDKKEENDSIEDLITLVEETRKSIAHIRHNSFHYKEKTLMKILELVGEDNEKNAKYIVSKKHFIRDIEYLNDAFREQIRSIGILEYYPVNLLAKCFCDCGLEFQLYSPQNPMIPSFSKVYKKGCNLYKSDKQNHKGLSWFIEVPNYDQGRLAYKNLLQLIYYHVFLPDVKSNEILITSFINSTKAWNKEEAKNAGENIYRYEAMPDYNGESLNDYFKILQRDQMLREKEVQEADGKRNYYILYSIYTRCYGTGF